MAKIYSHPLKFLLISQDEACPPPLHNQVQNAQWKKSEDFGSIIYLRIKE